MAGMDLESAWPAKHFWTKLAQTTNPSRELLVKSVKAKVLVLTMNATPKVAIDNLKELVSVYKTEYMDTFVDAEFKQEMANLAVHVEEVESPCAWEVDLKVKVDQLETVVSQVSKSSVTGVLKNYSSGRDILNACGQKLYGLKQLVAKEAELVVAANPFKKTGDFFP